jgi:hypothetical protein
MVFRSVAIFCWVLPSMVASSPMPLTCPAEATNRLSARLKSKYGEDSVVLVTKNKDGSFATQGDINKLKDNYKVKITGHVKGYLQALYHLPLIHPHRSYQHILYDPRLQ